MNDHIIIDPITHDPQEAYEIIRAHFTKPGAQLSFHMESSLYYDSERVMCDYRGPNGAMCAFGVLIPDDQYRKEMEGTKATLFLGKDESEEFLTFVQKAQNAHDDTANAEGNVADFVKKLDELAKGRGLTVKS